MLSWFKSWFTEPEPNRPFVVYIRQHKVAQSTTREEAEKYIQEIFEKSDSSFLGGSGWGTRQGVSQKRRRNAFRGQCKIVEMCNLCNRRVGHCGQC